MAIKIGGNVVISDSRVASFIRVNTTAISNGASSWENNQLKLKDDGGVADHLIFYNGTTRVGEIGVLDDTWLRLNEVTDNPIYTPRYIRADSGFFVDSLSTGIDGTGNLIGIGTGAFSGNITAASINVSGNLTGDVIGNLTGDVTGDLTGDVIGNLTGDVTGDVTAASIDVSGSSAAITMTGATGAKTFDIWVGEDDQSEYYDNASFIKTTLLNSLYIQGENSNSDAITCISVNNHPEFPYVTLHHNGDLKMHTTSLGIDVTGRVVCDMLHLPSAPNWVPCISSSQTSIGKESCINQNGGCGSVAFGWRTLKDNISGAHNTAIGNEVLENCTTGSHNTGVGVAALYQTYIGHGNTGVGSGALQNFNTGDNNMCLGHDANPSDINISNEITLGDAYIATLRCMVTSLTYLSDERDKTDIVDSKYGINFIKELKPRQFKWKTRDGSIKDGQTKVGFIAQELLEAANGDNDILDLVYESNPDKLEASMGNLIPILVKAIQEQQQQIEELKNGN